MTHFAELLCLLCPSLHLHHSVPACICPSIPTPVNDTSDNVRKVVSDDKGDKSITALAQYKDKVAKDASEEEVTYHPAAEARIVIRMSRQ